MPFFCLCEVFLSYEQLQALVVGGRGDRVKPTIASLFYRWNILKISELASFSHTPKLQDISLHFFHAQLKHPFAEKQIAKDRSLYKQHVPHQAAEYPLPLTPF